jgi:hypothetical protein
MYDKQDRDSVMTEQKGVNDLVVTDATVAKAPETAWLKVLDLEVDDGYQHRSYPKFIADLRKDFRPEYSGFILVNVRKDGRMFIVDGQTRTAVHQELRIPLIRAEILRGKTAEEEAQIYMVKCKNTQRIPVDFFRAEVAAGVNDAVLLNKILEERQIQIQSFAPVPRSRGQHATLTCLTTVRRLLRQDPTGEWLGDTLDLIRATWGFIDGALTMYNIAAIHALFLRYRDKIIFKTFVNKFKDISFEQLRVESEQKRLASPHSRLSLTQARLQVLEDIHDKSLVEAKRLSSRERVA